MAAASESVDTFGDFIIRRGKLAPDALHRARAVQAPGDRLPALLLRLGMVSEKDLAELLAEFTGVHAATTDQYPALPLFEDRLSAKFLREARALPIQAGEDGVVVAMAFPDDSYARQALSLALELPVIARAGLASEIDAAIERLYAGSGTAAPEQAPEHRVGMRDDDVEHLRDLASEAPVIRVVNMLLQRAMTARASDIHIEPFEHRLRVRLRIDGVLREIESPVAQPAAIISRIKIMARLNIAERRLPQDGRLQLRYQGREVDVRVSAVPTLYGESVVLRILDRQNLVLDFEALGFRGVALQRLSRALAQPHGIVLVTGPTGSGKTTTLYTALHKLNDSERKIFTVEDPIEYQLDGVNQLQVNPQIELTFASALRAILRQDPDVIMVGEMRDAETARIAVQAALTGHLVLSTLHTNDAGGTIARLLDMGVEDYLLGSTLQAVVAQRLVRVLCMKCRAQREMPSDFRQRMSLHCELPARATLYEARGCVDCNHTGYAGRMSILEVLPIEHRVRQLIMQRADAAALQAAAIEAGMQTMFEDGVLKACEGMTSVEEVMRVSRGFDDAAVPL